MSDSPPGTCPTCHAGVTSGSAFCTRCGAILPDVTVIAVPVAEQQWGGSGGARRRDRRAGKTPTPASPVPPTPAQQPHPAAVASAAAVPYPGTAEGNPGSAPILVAATPVRWAAAVPGSDQYGPPQYGPPQYAPAPVADSHYGSALHAPVVAAHDVALGPAFDGVSPATTGRRLGAYALDWLSGWLVGGAVLAVTGSPVHAGLAVGELAVGLVVWEARSGTTIGNALLGLRTAKVETPYAPGLGRAVGRAAVLVAGHLGLGVGQWVVVASSAFDGSGRRQGWHDKAGRTVVVDVRSLRSDPVADELPVVRAPVVTTPAVVASAVSQAAVSSAAVPRPPAPPVPASAPVLPVPGGQVPDRSAAGPAPAPSVPQALSASPAPEPVPSAPVVASYVVTVDTGVVMTVSGPGYVGRRPSPPEGVPCDHVIEIEDPGRSLSRTHARFGIDGGAFWVEDNHSANGTFVLGADGSSVQGVAGERLVVPAGGTVRLGQRTFTVRPCR